MSTTTTSPCPSSGTILPKGVGPARIAAFMNSTKRSKLDKAVGGLLTSIPLDLGLFTSMLLQFDFSIYNGVRMYFVCYPDVAENGPAPHDKPKQIGLIFVPTKGHPGYTTGDDDKNFMFHLYDTT